MDLSKVLLIIAIVLFAIAALSPRFIGDRPSPIDLIAAGLFFWALSEAV